MNLALGALAVALTAAILALLLVGEGEGSTVPQETTPTVTVPPTGSPESTPPGGGSTQFQAAEQPKGRWQTPNRATIVQFSGNTIESFQSLIDLEEGSVTLNSTEPARLRSAPTTGQTVQAVVFITLETETRRTGPDPILAEFVATEGGMSMTFEIAGSKQEFTLLPS